MAVTFSGYVPFYNSNGMLMCTVPCFDIGVPYPFGTHEPGFISSAAISKSTFDSVFANVEFLATKELIKNIVIKYGTIFTNNNNGWAICPVSSQISDPITNGAYGYYENGELIKQRSFRYSGNASDPSNTDESLNAFFLFTDIDVPVATNIMIVDEAEAYAKFYGNKYPQFPIQPKFNVELIDYAYIYDESRPPNPSEIVGMSIKPSNYYAYPGQTIQYKAFYVYRNDFELEAKNVTWGITLSTLSSDVPEQVVDGVSIDDNGLVTIPETGNEKIFYIRAHSKNLNMNKQAALSVEWDYTPGSESGGYIPNPGNQYFPGGTSGGSGVPQGSYDNVFGPNTSVLIPGLDSTGQSTGQEGAVGNDISLSGMYTKYLMNQDYLNTLAQFFWEDNVGIQALKLAFGNPIDSIISLISYPFNLDLRVPTVAQNIFFGKYDSLFTGQAITRSSFQIDWGTIPIDFYWGNFLDYAPYTQVQLYLPWGVGFVSIDPNEVMPYSKVPNDFNPVNYNKGSIRVVTNIELDKGACVHNVIGNRGLVIGTYGGIVGKQIPMTALDNSAKMLALLGAASGVGMAAGNAMASAATGKYTNTMAMPFQSFSRGQYGPNMRQGMGSLDVFDSGAMASDLGSSRAMKAGLASAAALASTPPNYPRAGTFSDATNTMCPQVPYIIISRPSQSVPQNYGHYNGYPSNIYYNKLSMVSGYTEISEIHLDSVPGSVQELEELDSMLKGGVLL